MNKTDCEENAQIVEETTSTEETIEDALKERGLFCETCNMD